MTPGQVATQLKLKWSKNTSTITQLLIASNTNNSACSLHNHTLMYIQH